MDLKQNRFFSRAHLYLSSYIAMENTLEVALYTVFLVLHLPFRFIKLK